MLIRCRTICIREDDGKKLTIKDKEIENVGDYVLGNQLYKALRNAEKNDGINMGMSIPLSGFLSNRTAIKFSVTQHLDKAEQLIKEFLHDYKNGKDCKVVLR